MEFVIVVHDEKISKQEAAPFITERSAPAAFVLHGIMVYGPFKSMSGASEAARKIPNRQSWSIRPFFPPPEKYRELQDRECDFSNGDRVRDQDGFTGTVTRVRKGMVSVKLDTGGTHRYPWDDLRNDEIRFKVEPEEVVCENCGHRERTRTEAGEPIAYHSFCPTCDEPMP